MDKTSSIVTAASATAAGFITPAVDWVLNTVFQCQAPASVISVFAVLIVGGAHLAANVINDRLNLKVQAAAPATLGVQQ